MKSRKVRKGIWGLAAIGLSALVGCGSSEPQQEADTEVETVDQETTEQTENKVGEDVPQLEGYNLLWHDEFDGDALDMDVWNCEPRQPGWTNNELQEYTTSEENVFVRDGKLVLKAIKTADEHGKDYYTSGKVTTHKKKDFMYGKVSVRAKAPEGQGLWPAIWMMPTDENHYGQWPKCGEIDIMEVLGNDVNVTYGTIHYGEPHAEQQERYVLTEGSFADDFHEFSVEWEPGEMRFYVDDNLFHTVNDWFSAVAGADDRPYPAPFNQTFFVQLNLAVGGNWPGNPDETTDFDKAEFEIDYVRVYQKESYDTNVTKPPLVLREPTEDGNYIYNGSFTDAEDLTDNTDWKFLLAQNGEGAAEIKDGQMIITSTQAGDVDYSVQLVQAKLPMLKGNKYRITFDACASEERDIVVCVSAPTAGWIRYFPDTRLTITEEWETYVFEYEMKARDDANGRLEFNLGHRGSTADVYLKNVRVEQVE